MHGGWRVEGDVMVARGKEGKEGKDGVRRF